ncbi:hypothetical protein T12_2082, partial [Trichinella patagoniensis]
LRQSSSAGARIDLSSVRFQCDMTKITVPVCLFTNRRNFILFMTAMKYQWITSPSENFCSVAADATQIAFPTVLMFFLVTQVRNCEDESRILNDLH